MVLTDRDYEALIQDKEHSLEGKTELELDKLDTLTQTTPADRSRLVRAIEHGAIDGDIDLGAEMTMTARVRTWSTLSLAERLALIEIANEEARHQAGN